MSSSTLTSAVAAMRAFFQSHSAFIAGLVTISWDGIGIEKDVATGQLIGVTAYTPPASVACSGSGTCALPAGASVRWNTSTVVNGRMIRGRTFIVPLVSTSYESNGSLVSTYLTASIAAAAAVRTASLASGTWTRAIWHRPVGGAGGATGEVMSSSVKDIVAVLKSRRD